ncbi:MAG: hypothetical protein KAT68_06220 [Bacteroidales bacterium]|nr:hypothetical protein [Bacteroidales bacterium]
MNKKNFNPVLVLGLYIPGIDIIKHFTKKKIECLGVDFRDDAIGYLLRGKKTIKCPDPEENETIFIDFIISIQKKWKKKAVVFITSDCFIKTILKNENILKKHFYFNTSKNFITEKLMSKEEMYKVAVNTNIPVPLMISPITKDELLKEMNNLSFPCVIKPKYAQSWRKKPLENIVDSKKVVYVKTKNELINQWEIISKYDNNIIIQEVVPGPDENLLYFVCYIDKNGTCLGYFCGRKLRITPIHFGSASFMKTTDPSPIKDYCLNLLIKNEYYGPAGVEMKKDENDGSYKLIEVNTRIGLWDIIGKKLEVDIYTIAYNELIGKEQNSVKPLNKNIYWVSISRDIPTFLEYKKEGSLSFIKWIKSYFNKVYYSDIYWNEPSLMYRLYIKRVLKKIF